MTIEELEIIIEANIEPAIKEIKKLMPQIKTSVEQAVNVAQKSMEQVDMKKMTSKVQKAIQDVKNKISSLKKSNKDNEVTIKINNEEAKKQITQLEKEISSLQKKISARQIKLDLINPQMDKIISDTRNEVVPNGVSKNDPSMDKVVDNSLAKNTNFKALSNQSQKLYTEVELYNKQLDIAKTKMLQLKQQISDSSNSQNKLASFFNSFKNELGQAYKTVVSIKNAFNQLPRITQKITNNIKNMGNGLRLGLKHVLKYAMALFSLRGIYSVLSNSARSWLNSQNAEAKQLKANIEYMKYAMGSSFAPVIEMVTSLIFKLMKAVQSLVHAFSGINIFAKATASSMANTAGSAGKASKSLAGIHGEINNVSENDSSGSGSNTPSIDLSQVDAEMSSFSQKLYNFFKPLKDSWDVYGNGLIGQINTTVNQIVGLISSVWGSFENIITNGTVYTILANILAIIGNISEAFSNAWNYNGNGDAIIQNVANALNNLLNAINNVIQNEKFQEFLNNCSDKFKTISEKIAEIDWQPLVDAITSVGSNIGEIALTILTGVVDIFKWLVEHPIVAEILLAIAAAISIVSTALSIWSTVQAIINAELWACPITWIIAAIVALIAAIILIVVNWDTVSEALSKAWEWIKEKAKEIFSAIAEFFKNLWEGIKNVAITVWNAIKNFFINIWNKIKETVSNVFNAIKTTISNIWNGIKTTITNVVTTIKDKISIAFTNIKNKITDIMDKVKTTISNVWNGIWGVIKGVVNSILGGIESFVNGTIKGINKILSGISSVANAVGSLIGLDPINLQLSTISLPRLAKGNVAYSETMAIFGEYSGASHNPEITTPQNIMRETFADVLSDYGATSGNGQPIRVQIYWGTKAVVDEIIDGINEKTRQTGKAQIKVSYA